MASCTAELLIGRLLSVLAVQGIRELESNFTIFSYQGRFRLFLEGVTGLAVDVVQTHGVKPVEVVSRLF